MQLFSTATVFVVVALGGVAFSVAAFVDSAAWRLAPEPQLVLLSRLASLLGKVMPVWYPVSGLMIGVQTWLGWHTPARGILLAALAIWILASVASIVFLVPLGRTVALAIAAVLLTYAVVR